MLTLLVNTRKSIFCLINTVCNVSRSASNLSASLNNASRSASNAGGRIPFATRAAEVSLMTTSVTCTIGGNWLLGESSGFTRLSFPGFIVAVES